jgi:BolA family transcriptional regulator, general stress-responsive regulator
MTSTLIRQALEQALNPELIEILDQSAAHAGHQYASGGHYHLTIVSRAFENLSLIKRHQLIYQALGDLMKEQIHAIGINALTPSEHSIGNP